MKLLGVRWLKTSLIIWQTKKILNEQKKSIILLFSRTNVVCKVVLLWSRSYVLLYEIWKMITEYGLRQNVKISYNQFEFLPKRSTTKVIYSLDSSNYRAISKQPIIELYIFITDLEFKKTYDKVLREVIWWALMKKGVPMNIVIIKDMDMYDVVVGNFRARGDLISNFFLLKLNSINAILVHHSDGLAYQSYSE